MPTPAPTAALPLEQAIVGQWGNAQGGRITFYADKTGYIPGDATQNPPIPEATFTYSMAGPTRLRLELGPGSSLLVEVKIEGDTMTWRGPNSGKEFTYKRIAEQ